MEKLKLFGKRIKELRKAKNLTQEQLAEILGIYQKQIGNIETGTYFTTMPNLEKLSLALGVEIKDLFDFEHHKDTEVLKSEIQKMLDSADLSQLKLIYKIIKSIVI